MKSNKLVFFKLIFLINIIFTNVYPSQLTYFYTIADDQNFTSLLNQIGRLHKDYYEKLECIAVFNGGLDHEQVDLLIRIEKIQIYAIEHMETFNHMLIQTPAIENSLQKQLCDIFGFDKKFIWLNLDITLDYQPYIKYKEEISEKPFVIIIASYNNEKWYFINLMSAISQNYSNFRIIYINDNSKDNTAVLVSDFLKQYDVGKKISFINNNERIGALANYYHAIYLCQPQEIIVMLDGDDWLIDENVLSTLNKVYQDNDIWITYGQWKSYPYNYLGNSRQLPAEVIAAKNYRQSEWVTSHLRTFYAALFHKIKRSDFLYQNEIFFPMAWDQVIMFALLELGGEHSKFISDILYIYNQANPINDDKINLAFQINLENIIRKQQKYETTYNLF